jgi:hypothetical protein
VGGQCLADGVVAGGDGQRGVIGGQEACRPDVPASVIDPVGRGGSTPVVGS